MLMINFFEKEQNNEQIYSFCLVCYLGDTNKMDQKVKQYMQW